MVVPNPVSHRAVEFPNFSAVDLMPIIASSYLSCSSDKPGVYTDIPNFAYGY